MQIPGPGMGRAVARGIAMAPPPDARPFGLAGPVRGAGGPAPSVMQPHTQSLFQYFF